MCSLLPVGQPHGSRDDMEVTALFAVSDKKPKRQAATLQTWDIAAEEAIASVVEEMELPADMTLQTKVESGRNKAGSFSKKPAGAMT